MARSWASAASKSASGRPLFDRAREPVQPLHAVQLLGVTDPRGIERAAQDRNGLVVGERHRKRMAVLAAVRERKSRQIVEARRRAVHDFGDQRQRLQRPRPELLEQQQRRRSRASSRS